MIQVRARLGDGLTSIEVTGHEGHGEDSRVCAAITAITQTALLGLDLYAQQFPDLVSVEIIEE